MRPGRVIGRIVPELRQSVVALIGDDSGAVTVDWVVLSAALIGTGVAATGVIGSGVLNSASGITTGIEAAGDVAYTWTREANTLNAAYFFDMGILEYPANQESAWRSARYQVHLNAPEGYEYDPDLRATRYIDTETGFPIYVSTDRQTYSIGGNVIAVADYDVSKRVSFKNGFDAYWASSR